MAPGPYLGRYILQRRGISPEAAAHDIGIAPEFMRGLLDDRIAIDRPLAIRLGAYSGTTAEFWLTLQEAWSYANEIVKPSDRSRYIQIDPYTPGD